MVTALKQVKSHFSTIMFTGKGTEKSEMLIVNTDGTLPTDKILDYENRKFSGCYDEKAERKAQELLQNIIRSLKSQEVINPHAGEVVLPVNSHAIIRMNHLFQSLIKQVSLFHQYQRKRDSKGRIIAQKEDIQIAADMLLGAMVMENDEIEPGLRKFFDDIKEYIQNKAGKKANASWFTLRELRRELDVSRSACFRYISELHRLAYIERTGYANKGLRYKISYWDDTEKNRKQMKEKINEQLKTIGIPQENTPFGTPEPATPKASIGSIPSAA
jgi:hypothetical protein